MNSNLVSRLSQTVFALVMLVYAFLHLSNGAGMAGMVPEFIPGGVIWVYISGIALALAGLAFILNIKVRLAGYLLGTLLLIFALTMHLPGLIGGNQMSMPMLLKDTGLAAAAFYIGSKNV